MSPLRDIFDSKIRTLLTQEAAALADRARAKAPTERIRSNIEVGQVRKEGDKYSIAVSVSLKKAPEAGAYEYGSGFHATQGTPGKYPIVAKNAPNLVFWWEKRNKLFVGPSVNHPGVAPRPYLKPAAQETKKTIREKMGFLLRLLFKTEIVQTINEKRIGTV